MIPMSRFRSRVPAVLFATALVAQLNGQSVPAPSGGANDPQPASTVVLSPFTVDATQDRGYTVTRDVSGSRLNTDLKNISAAVTVFTQEMLQDLNAVNALDAMDFAPNTMRDEQGMSNVDFNNIPIRVRGIRGGSADVTSATQDFFPVYDELDTYKIDRMGFGRGPNSILFGIGQPAGVITASTKQALFKDAYELQARFDNWGSARGMVDANKVIIPDRLALRAVYLQQYQTGAIRPQYKRDNRIYLAGTAKLFDRPSYRTTLRANFERVDGDDLIPNGSLPRDNFTTWWQAGAPVSTLPGTAANRPFGTSNQSTANQLVFINDPANGSNILNWRNMLQANGLAPLAVYDERYAPYDVNVKGNDGNVPRHLQHMSAFLEQQIGPNLFLELAAHHGEEYREWGIKVGGIGIGGDPNERLPNGQPNPNAGKPYVQYDGRSDNRLGEADVIRLTASYDLDFADIAPGAARWLGRHTLYGLFEHTKIDTRTELLQLVNTTPLPGFPASLANAQNRVFMRSYLDFDRGVYTFRPGNYRQTIVANGVTAEWLPVGEQRASVQKFDSTVFAMQNYFWKDRIVTTLGWRTDEIESLAGNPVADARGVFPLARTQSVSKTQEGRLKPRSLGAVFHALPWLSFQYNESNNYSGLALDQENAFGQNLPATSGETKDYGVKVNLFQDRLALNFVLFETSQKDAFGNANADREINQFWDLLNRPDMLLSPWPGTKDTFDNSAEGWESTIVYNPMPNWRIYATVSKTKSSQANVYPATTAYIQQHLATWEAVSNQTIADGRTVRTAIDEMLDNLTTRKAQEGAQSYNQREWNASLATNYTFTRGVLKGAFVGGSLLYRGDAVVGYPQVAGRPVKDQPYVEEGYVTVNLNLGYERRIFDRYLWRTQLGIQEVGNYDGRMLVTLRNAAGQAQVAGTRWMPGTSLILTTGVKF